MRNISILAVLTAMVFNGALSAFIITVPIDYGGIQAGIDASMAGDTVLVAPGIYFENIHFNGHNILLGSIFLTTVDTNYIFCTIIDGCHQGSVVKFENAEDSSSAIVGFTIRNGINDYGGGIICRYGSNPKIMHNLITDNAANGSGYPHFDGCGGGICCDSANPIISFNYVQNNRADLSGGGICCVNNSNASIIGNRISNNTAYYSAGVHCSGQSDAIISGNLIIGNMAGHEGGGVQILSSNALLSNNFISANHSAEIGGGLCFQLGACPLIKNNLICGNSASFYAAGLYCNGNANPVLINNTITNNNAPLASGLYCRGNSNPVLVNTILWNEVSEEIVFSQFNDSNSITIGFSDIRGGETNIVTNNNGIVYWQEGNIVSDPLFRDYANDDFHLMNVVCGDLNDSPCIDAGNPVISDTLLDCDWGLGTMQSDIGAYGGGDSINQAIDDNPASMSKKLLSLWNSPNPFNSQTTITCYVREAAEVKLEIFDILGRQVETVIDNYCRPGSYNIIWNVGTMPSGIYFAITKAGNETQKTKMLLLK